ncbi:MAG: DNA mismatch repair protein MutT [Bdellovibrio sp. ArHS]|uniref:(deoxy)nucleoside triphosphate pyrophosphohydrolase n=1 Tax=Bdellovibrio sp. ArHS TaxID=1569284 RepID=UPI0005826D67|nr:(deoxy)nucleoside triphosphate pyrophosphohydrolase [Bdellovibrio sp. ArHS]KHD89631.1 MAG: DNA mismatch repair protein MutT [Bdellovibrio sp. ArHS]
MTEKTPVVVVAAVIRRFADPEKRILIVRRGPEQSGAGFWEFPGGKVEMDESSEQALQREIEEELGIAIRVGDFIGEEDFLYPTKLIRLRVYWAETQERDLVLTEHDAFRWCLPEEISLSDLSEADRPFVGKILGK